MAAVTVSVGSLMANFGIQKAKGRAKAEGITNGPKDVKDIFKKCGTCSHTFCYILDRDFGQIRENEEYATDPLAGGLMMGHQCGMLWGSALAIGNESYRRNKDQGTAVATAINTTRLVMHSFAKTAGSVNCRDVSPADFTKKSGMAKFMLLVITSGGMKNTPCFNLAEDWAPEAIQTAQQGLSASHEGLTSGSLSCASEVVRKMGGSAEEIVMISGFAGGMGLEGHACGALAAAVWMNTLQWCRKNPGKMAPLFNPKKSGLLQHFSTASGSEILCSKITGRSFQSVQEHSEFIKNGGCSKIIEVLSQPVLRT